MNLCAICELPCDTSNTKRNEVCLQKRFRNDYVVRIYRHDKKNPRHLVGVVEEVGVKGKKAFANYDELWEILISSKSTKRNRKTRIKRSAALVIYPRKRRKR